MIYIPTAIAGLALLRCFALEKRSRRQAERITKLIAFMNQRASG